MINSGSPPALNAAEELSGSSKLGKSERLGSKELFGCSEILNLCQQNIFCLSILTPASWFWPLKRAGSALFSFASKVTRSCWLLSEPAAAVRTETENPFDQRREGSFFCFLREMLSLLQFRFHLLAGTRPYTACQ